MDSLPFENNRSAPSVEVRYPWYVHLLGGYALTGAFCWLLVGNIFWRRGRRWPAVTLIAANVLLLMAMIWSALRFETAWWWLYGFMTVFNLVWAMSAWLFQYLRFGPAPRRYHKTQWRRWVMPLASGVLLGLGFVVSITVIPAIGERFGALRHGETAVRSLVLWQFFKSLPLGLAVGLLVGAWWAGDGRFTVSHIISFLAGIILTFVAQAVLIRVFTLIIDGGEASSLTRLSGGAWALVPGRLQGWPRFIGVLDNLEYIGLVPLGLLFGVPNRIRDFLKRSALVVPLVTVLSLSFSFFSQTGWSLIQGRIIHQTVSADDGGRASAFNWLQVLLARYPNHAQWPHLAARLADFQYSRGEFDIARRLHEQIIDRYADANRWQVQVEMSRAIVASPLFGKPSGRQTRLSIPMVNYQDYLTQNWMALLATVRYWQDEATPVSELFIRLRDISESDDNIKLPKLTHLADLDDAAAALGCELTLLPADVETTKALLKAGLPVLLPVYQTFYLIYGFDESRGVIQSLCFGQLSAKTRSLAVKEAQEVLMLEAEGKGRSKDQLARIRREAQCMWHQDQWRTGRLKDAAPWMAVLLPSNDRGKIAAALGRDAKQLAADHRGYLAAMIALNYFDNADPVDCIRWARIASRCIDDSLVYQAAHLGAELWRHRAERIGTAFQLEKQFDTLDEVNRYLQTASVQQFLETAAERFASDQSAGRLNWPIRRRLLWLLDRNDTQQRAQMVKLVQADVATNPADAGQWRLLADLYTQDENGAAHSQALAQASSADPYDADTALAWASACVQLNDPAQADEILTRVDPAKVRHKAEYLFCRAAVAEWKQQPRTALRYYAQAIDMCRYRPEYFLRYGRLLLAQGDTKAAKRALTWAERIDGMGTVRQEAQKALGKHTVE